MQLSGPWPGVDDATTALLLQFHCQAASLAQRQRHDSDVHATYPGALSAWRGIMSLKESGPPQGGRGLALKSGFGLGGD